MDFEQLLGQELFRTLGRIDVRRNSVTAEDRAQLLSSVPKDLADEIGNQVLALNVASLAVVTSVGVTYLLDKFKEKKARVQK